MTTIDNHMPSRQWITNTASERTDKQEFSILTYNILGDKMIQEGQYLHCDVSDQRYPKRHARILSELTRMSADIACFQEVERVLWLTWLLPGLRDLGYDGVHFESPHDLGVAVLWKTTMFTCEHSEGHVSSELAEPMVQSAIADESRKEKIREFIRRPSPVLLVKLRHSSGAVPLYLVNIHTVWDDALYPQIQTLQIGASLARLKEMMGGSIDGAVILLGDFNAPPDSVTYNFHAKGWNESTLKKFKQYVNCRCPMSEKDCSQVACGLPEMIPDLFRHDFPLSSAYKTLKGYEPSVTSADGAPSYTTYCLDYVWYQERWLVPIAALDLPPIDILKNPEKFPMTQDFPSDHLPLFVKFSFD